jgi:Secretion system C-terminal sorting domain
MRFFLAILLLILCAQSYLGQSFNIRLSMGVETSDEGMFCFEIDENYFFVGGHNNSNGPAKSGMFALNDVGEIQNSIVFFNDSTAYYISGASGGDIRNNKMVAGGIIIRPPDLTRIGIVVVFDEFGDTLVTGEYLSPNEENVRFYKGIITDSGYLGCGTVDNINEEDVAIGILVKFDLEGNVLWRQDYQPQNNLGVFLYSADQTPDGGFLLGGSRISGENNDHLVIKTDSLGNEEWRKVEGNQYQNGTAMVTNTGDGNFIFCGWNSINSTYNSYPQVTKLDLEGDTIWSRNYGSIGVMKTARSIKLLDDGGFVFCGSDRLQGVLYGQIRKIDADGNEIWYRRYTHTEGIDCWFNDVTPTSDGGYILTGLLGGDQDLGIEQDMWAMKVDSYGCLVPGCELINVDELHPTALSIYPNPCDDFINVFVESILLNDCEISLFDIHGKLISASPVRESGSTLLFDSNALPEGIYILNLSVDGKVMSSEKVAVVHE